MPPQQSVYLSVTAPVSMSLIAVIGACDYRLSFTDIGQLDGSLFMESSKSLSPVEQTNGWDPVAALSWFVKLFESMPFLPLLDNTAVSKVNLMSLIL